MIHSVNFLDMTEKLDPYEVCEYLKQMDWNPFPFKRQDVKIFQFVKNDLFRQVMVPLDKSFSDYKNVMYDVVQNIADVEGKSIKQIMLYLLNPNTDILKIRFDKEGIECGNILFDDAIELFKNAKKLLAATALDIINPKKIHYGRVDASVQKFLNQCRFGQTEVGSYVVSVICPFAELSEEKGYKQLSIFSDEELFANSLTRKVTNKLIENVVFVKKHIDEDRMDILLEDDVNISSNFLEALNGLNSQSEKTYVEFTTDWSPAVKINRSEYDHVVVTNDYYEPIASIIDKIKEERINTTEIIGRIFQLSAKPKVDERIKGIINVSFIDENQKIRSVKVNLEKEDYELAVKAHQYGKVVKIVGDLKKDGTLKMENAVFSVLD